MYNIIKNKKYWFGFSGILVAISIIVLSVWGLKLGIDFTGGSLLEVSYESNRPSISQVEESLQSLELQSLLIQPSGDDNFFLGFENGGEDRPHV